MRLEADDVIRYGKGPWAHQRCVPMPADATHGEWTRHIRGVIMPRLRFLRGLPHVHMATADLAKAATSLRIHYRELKL